MSSAPPAVEREPDGLIEAQAAEYGPAPVPLVQRASPSDQAAEEAVLGVLMAAPKTTATVLDMLAIEDFHHPGNGTLYGAIRRTAETGANPDSVTIPAVIGQPAFDALGGVARVVDLQANGAMPSNAEQYAEIILDRSRERQAIAVAGAIEDAARSGRGLDEALAEVQTLTSGHRDCRTTGDRLCRGGGFVLDASSVAPAVWGTGQLVPWAQGEPLLLVGPTGVGKTTVAGQLVKARLGLVDEVLGYRVEPDPLGVLYLAMDRPAQVRRSMNRQFTEDDRDVLNERMTVWEGPPPRDLARHPETLIDLVQKAGRGTVVIDSVKDAAVGLVDDEVGAGLNRALQECVAAGIEVLGLHHQRKGQAGARPRTLEDVYGSTWITAGAGSVLLLWGSAGDPVVELIHLKQPAEDIGPLRIEHHAPSGTSTIYQGFDVLDYLRACGTSGASTTDVACLLVNKDDPDDNERRKAKRRLDRLVTDGHATTSGPTKGGQGGTSAARYWATGSPT